MRPPLHAPDLLQLQLEQLRALAVYRAVPLPPPDGGQAAEREFLIGALSNLPPTAGHRSMYAGKRLVRAMPWRNGGNPRQPGSHGNRAYNLIPLGDFGIRAEDLLGRIRRLPAKSSPRYGAGGTNHLTWDLSHGFTVLIEDPGPPFNVAGMDDGLAAVHEPRLQPRAGPSAPAADLNEPAPGRRVEIRSTRVVRDSELVRWLKYLHQDRCQICGIALQGQTQATYSEGHHLRPVGSPHDGPDVAANILILCPNHHALCDFGMIRLTAGSLRQAPGHEVGDEYVRYHNEQVYRGRPNGG
jgi:hypothetical protein